MSNYGFGWRLTSYRGHYRVEHGGNIDGFTGSTSFSQAIVSVSSFSVTRMAHKFLQWFEI